MPTFHQPGQTILLEIDGHAVGRLLSTEAKDVIPQISDYGYGKSVWLCSISGSRSVVDWISSTAVSKFNRRNVRLMIIDGIRKKGTELAMFDCLLAKVTLPVLDKASSAAALIRLEVQPERSRTSTLGDIQTISIPPLKEPSKASEFDFVIDGLDDAKFVQRVESMTFEVGTKKVYRHNSGPIEPTKISDSNIVISLPVQHGAAFLKWSEETRNPDSRGNLGQEKTGRVRYLANNSVALEANLYGLSPIRTTRSGPALTIEMVCGRMEVDGASADF
jgi:hypothetical protein